MPADDHPIDALKHQFELEDSSVSLIPRVVLELISRTPLTWPFDSVVAKLKDRISADSNDRIRIMLETCKEEILKQQCEIDALKMSLSAEESEQRADIARDLISDAARKASNTRAIERVRHIGTILANGTTEAKPTDSDEIEEMMRIAMELNDRDISHLRELVRVEGTLVERSGRIERYTGHTMWEQCYWGTRLDGELDSVFSKLVSYGLVAQIPPPSNLNIMADFQNRYILLKKGLRFVNLVKQKVSTTI